MTYGNCRQQHQPPDLWLKIIMMELKKGLTFKKYYNENNFNNIGYCEVRGIVDDEIIVLLCRKEANKLSKAKVFYKSIDVDQFNYNVTNGVYLPI